MSRHPVPAWALICSCVLHALLLRLPVGVAPPALPRGAPIPRLEASLAPALNPPAARPADTEAVTAEPAAAERTAVAEAVMVSAPEPVLPATPITLPHHYFSANEVDMRAEPIEVAPLLYPEDAYLRRLPGKVQLRVFISDSGTIDAIDIVTAEPPAVFDQAAVDALVQTRFRPAELLKRPVRSVKLIEVVFDPFADR